MNHFRSVVRPVGDDKFAIAETDRGIPASAAARTIWYISDMGEIAATENESVIGHMSIQEYFRFDNETPGKHEYYRGSVIAMAGGTTNHSAIAFNLGGEIRQKLRGTSCQGFTSDLRIGIPGVVSISYPDLSVVCGPLQYDPRDPNNQTVMNPRLIVEVLSPSTEHVDRGRKFENYLRLESLQEYVLVSQDHPHIVSYYRQPDGKWGTFTFATGLDGVLKVPCLSIEIPLAEVYANVVFPIFESPETDELPGDPSGMAKA